MAIVHQILKYLIQTNINIGCQSGRKVLPHDSKNDLPLIQINILPRAIELGIFNPVELYGIELPWNLIS